MNRRSLIVPIPGRRTIRELAFTSACSDVDFVMYDMVFWPQYNGEVPSVQPFDKDLGWQYPKFFRLHLGGRIEYGSHKCFF
jgi:hypothetical protein